MKSSIQIQPIEFSKKEEFLSDICSIFHFTIGRIDYLNSNLFFRESAQLIINSINLFSLGYFDTAFYSLRQSEEIAITTLYLASKKEKEDNWHKLKGGFDKKKMTDSLNKDIQDFYDIKNKMSDFFSDISESTKCVNKYVHKQGYKSFYSIRKIPTIKNKYPIEDIINDFECSLKAYISLLLLNRLVIDPSPILLRNNDIFNRLPQMICEPFSDKLIDKYFGDKNISDYKKTSIYLGYYNSIISREPYNDATLSIVHGNYIDRSKQKEILEQIHLLNFDERISCQLIFTSSSIFRILPSNILDYTCNTEPKIKESDFNYVSESYKCYFPTNNSFNNDYKGVYISKIVICDNDYYIFHNEKLLKDEVCKIKSFQENLNEEFRNLDDILKELLKDLKKNPQTKNTN